MLYDSFVRPPSKVVDYRTKYSGIHPGDLDKEGVATLREVDLEGEMLRSRHRTRYSN